MNKKERKMENKLDHSVTIKLTKQEIECLNKIAKRCCVSRHNFLRQVLRVAVGLEDMSISLQKLKEMI